MATAQHVVPDRKGPLTTVTIARPAVHYPSDGAAIARLTSAFEALRADDPLRVVAPTGEDRSFNAGAGRGPERLRAFLQQRVPAARTEEV